jgi:hypothetical protein
MARPKNPDNVYTLTCKVTGQTRKTNPNQFRDLMNRFNLTRDELVNSYVSSGPTGGRRILASEHLTPKQAVEKYGIHINMANKLAEIGTKKVSVPTPTTTAVEGINAEPVNTTVESTDSSYSVSIPAEQEVESDLVNA